MLGRIVAGAAKTIGTVAVGVAIDRATNLRGAKTTPAADPLAGHAVGSKWLPTGNQLFTAAVRRICPQDGSSAVVDAAKAQVTNREQLAQKIKALAADPAAAVEKIGKSIENVRNDVNTVRGAAAIAAGDASITLGEAKSIAQAVVTDTKTGYYRSAKAFVRGTYAAATTTPEGVAKVADAVKQRVSHDFKQATAGVAISSAAAGMIGAIPHPAAKVGAVVIRATSRLAAGAQMSESLRNVSGLADDSSATTRTMGKVLRAKVDSGPCSGENVAALGAAAEGRKLASKDGVKALRSRGG
jgi:hypothetical protein